MEKKQVSFNASTDDTLHATRLTAEQRAQQVQMAALKSRALPIGAVPPVRIPPLDAEPIPGGGTMAQMAGVLRDATSPLSPAYDPQLALLKKRMDQAVPAEAQNHPNFRPGVGSMISANQPPEVTAAAPKPVLSPSTQEGLRVLAEFQRQAEKIQTAEATKEEPADDTVQSALNDERRYVEEFRKLASEEQWNMLNNPERKKEIESRLAPLDISDIIVYGEIRQDVTIIPNKLSVTFRAVSGSEDLGVKRLMSDESGSERYMLDKFALMSLTCAVSAINGQSLPDHMKDKRFDDGLFKKKFDILMRYPVSFLADLGVQYMWFDHRQRKLFVNGAEALKNS